MDVPLLSDEFLGRCDPCRVYYPGLVLGLSAPVVPQGRGTSGDTDLDLKVSTLVVKGKAETVFVKTQSKIKG